MSDTITVTLTQQLGQHPRGAQVEYDRASAEFLIARGAAELVDEQPARGKRQPKQRAASTPPTVTDSDEGGE